MRHLLERGHEVLNVDVAPSPDSRDPFSPAPFLAADLTDFGQAFEVLNGGAARMPASEAVVHLAAIPSPVHATPDLTFGRTSSARTRSSQPPCAPACASSTRRAR